MQVPADQLTTLWKAINTTLTDSKLKAAELACVSQVDQTHRMIIAAVV